MITKYDATNLTMGQKLKMFRKLNNLTQDQLGQELGVSGKTISDWETEESEINLLNAKAICNFFNIPNSYFVFNENFDKIDSALKEKICKYIENFKLTTIIEKIISCCKQKIENDGIPLKKEYLPCFNYEKNNFTSYGIFDKNSIPIKIERNNSSSYNISINTCDLENLKTYSYSSSELVKFELLDILQIFNSEKVELIDLLNCNNLDTFKTTLEKMKTKKYTTKNLHNPLSEDIDISIKYIQTQLNSTLEKLNPNLPNFWKIIVFLIDNGAYYTKQEVSGNYAIVFNEVKDESKTNLIYRIAKDITL